MAESRKVKAGDAAKLSAMLRKVTTSTDSQFMLLEAWVFPSLFLLRIATSKDAGDIVQHIRCAGLVVPEILYQPLLHHVDLGLGLVVHDSGYDVFEFDCISLILEELQFQRLMQARVRLVLELLTVQR